MALFRVFLLLALVFVVSAKFADRVDELFEQFKTKFGRVYQNPKEESLRKEIFRVSMQRVDQKNDLNGEPVFGVTKFSDWTMDEYRALLGRKNRGRINKERLSIVRNPEETEKWNKNVKPLGSSSLPTYVNWADKGVITPVKNQGQCGACWAFSAAEAIESEWALQGNSLWEFSSQQPASCTTTCDGCGGGDTIDAYEYLESVVGLGSDWYAPYVQSMFPPTCNGKSCTAPCNYNLATMKEYSSLTGPYAVITGYSYATNPCTGSCMSQNTTMLAMNVATYGPPSICVNAETWNDYTGGVLTQSACGSYSYNSLDHCVQLVGYNATSSNPYWLVRNQWATNWGVDGYILLQYPLNTCGLADEATYVTIGNNQNDF